LLLLRHRHKPLFALLLQELLALVNSRRPMGTQALTVDTMPQLMAAEHNLTRRGCCWGCQTVCPAAGCPMTACWRCKRSVDVELAAACPFLCKFRLPRMPVVWLALCRKVDEKRQRYAELYLSSASALDDVRSYFHRDFEMLRFAGGSLPQQSTGGNAAVT
jgi:hypothetical protein